MFVDSRKAFLLAGAFLLATAAGAQQPQQDMPAGTMATHAAQSDPQTPTMTGRQMKAQKRQQKQQEKAQRNAPPQ